jgi:predicted nucleic acid-binding protein
MKITKERLKQIIKEETAIVMQEISSDQQDWWKQAAAKAGDNQDVIEGVINMLMWQYSLNKKTEDPRRVRELAKDLQNTYDIWDEYGDLNPDQPTEEQVHVLAAKHGIKLGSYEDSMHAAQMKSSKELAAKTLAQPRRGGGMSVRDQAADLARRGGYTNPYSSDHGK